MNLNQEQLEAVNNPASLIVVSAGPGSGKTRVIVERIKRVVREGCNPDAIVCITFTVAAAREINERLERDRIEIGYCGTIHGYTLGLLKEYNTIVNLPKYISVIGEDERDELVENHAKSLRYKGAKKAVEKALLDWRHGHVECHDAGLVASSYSVDCVYSGILDYDMILKLGIKLFKSNINHKISHLFWDEFQDSGVLDAEILSGLTCCAGNVFVVGDKHQAIYGFRGGSPEHMQRLWCAGWVSISMRGNYRCGAQICTFANNLIRANHTTAIVNTESEIDIWRHSNDTAESERIAFELLEKQKAGEINRCAILLRSNALVDKFKTHMAGRGVIVSGTNETLRPHDWSRCMDLIRFAANPTSDYLAERWLRRDPVNHAAMVALAKKRMSKLSDIECIGEWSVTTIGHLLSKNAISYESQAIVEAHVREMRTGDSLAQLITHLNGNSFEEKTDGVTITTMHSAKGREWDYVWLPAFEEGIIPSGKNIEEERRLAFVAITRARKSVIISHCETRTAVYGGNRIQQQKPSGFLEDLA